MKNAENKLIAKSTTSTNPESVNKYVDTSK